MILVKILCYRIAVWPLQVVYIRCFQTGRLLTFTTHFIITTGDFKIVRLWSANSCQSLSVCICLKSISFSDFSFQRAMWKQQFVPRSLLRPHRSYPFPSYPVPATFHHHLTTPTSEVSQFSVGVLVCIHLKLVSFLAGFRRYLSISISCIVSNSRWQIWNSDVLTVC